MNFFQKKIGTLKKSRNFAEELNFTALLRYPARGGVSIYYTQELKKCYIFLQLFLIQYLNLLILTEKKFQINGKEWKGNNLLGKLLTKLRDEKLKELK